MCKATEPHKGVILGIGCILEPKMVLLMFSWVSLLVHAFIPRWSVSAEHGWKSYLFPDFGDAYDILQVSTHVVLGTAQALAPRNLHRL